MIITLRADATDGQVAELIGRVQQLGYKPAEVRTQSQRYIVAVGQREFDLRVIGQAPGVLDVHRVSDAFKLVSRRWKVDPTEIDLGGGVKIKAGEFTIMAGPCSLESERQIRDVRDHLAAEGVWIMRGGAFKPRTSPYAFRGLGLEGLKLFKRLAAERGLKVVSEVLAASQIDLMYDYVDIFQVGTRNSQNFDLLHELGRVDKPVLLKRAMSGTLNELLQSAEYIFANGNERLILCERGVRSFETSYRNLLDLNAVPVLKEKSHLPVIVDPSHGVGVRRWVEPLALAAVMAGADGLIIEVHPLPEEAASDGDQTLCLNESARLIRRAREVFALRQGW